MTEKHFPPSLSASAVTQVAPRASKDFVSRGRGGRGERGKPSFARSTVAAREDAQGRIMVFSSDDEISAAVKGEADVGGATAHANGENTVPVVLGKRLRKEKKMEQVPNLKEANTPTLSPPHPHTTKQDLLL
jgi:hypothetical protein